MPFSAAFIASRFVDMTYGSVLVASKSRGTNTRQEYTGGTGNERVNFETEPFARFRIIKT